jgi:hypothetical protein
MDPPVETTMTCQKILVVPLPARLALSNNSRDAARISVRFLIAGSLFLIPPSLFATGGDKARSRYVNAGKLSTRSGRLD